MSVTTNIHIHDHDDLRVCVGHFADAGGLTLEVGGARLELFFYGIVGADLDPVRDAIEQALRKMRGEAEPSFQIAAE